MLACYHPGNDNASMLMFSRYTIYHVNILVWHVTMLIFAC